MLRDYRDTWRATGSGGRRFLAGGFAYAVRILAFGVAFPLFAKQRGFDSGDIGWLVGAASLTLFVFGIPVTMLGARGHARRLLIAGPVVAAAGQILIFAAPHGAFVWTFAGALLSGMVSTTFWVLGDPLLAETTPAPRLAHVYALKFSIITVGFALGGGLGGWIPAGLESAGLVKSDALAWSMIAIAIFDVVQSLTFAFIPRTTASAAIARSTARAAPKKPTHALTRRGVWIVLALLAAPEAGMALGHNSIRPFLALFFEEEHGLSAGLIGTTMAILALAGGAGALFTPAVARRLGNLRTIAVLRIAGSMAVLLCFSGVGSFAVVALLLVYYAVNDGTEATFITEAMERLPVDQRTTFSGLYAMVWSAASFAAAAASGAIQGAVGFGAAFALGVAGYSLSVAWILGVFPRLPLLVVTVREPIPETTAGSLPVTGRD